ncbi:MAG TPA: hypothetical protein VFK19_08750 [Sphingomicrobium sp.]|nr:hypothetical protein [Sphingomicrobium sp.]
MRWKRGLGWGLISTTLMFMIVPILAFLENPSQALSGAFEFYLLFVFIPLVSGFLLLFFDRKMRRRQQD